MEWTEHTIAHPTNYPHSNPITRTPSPFKHTLHTKPYLIALVDRLLQRLARIAHVQEPVGARQLRRDRARLGHGQLGLGGRVTRLAAADVRCSMNE